MKQLRVLPSSLVGRVFLLYSVALLAFVFISFVAFSNFQYRSALEEAQDSANMMVGVVAHVVTDSAVIGDYDTIQRTLDMAIPGSRFASAKFIFRQFPETSPSRRHINQISSEGKQGQGPVATTALAARSAALQACADCSAGTICASACRISDGRSASN